MGVTFRYATKKEKNSRSSLSVTPQVVPEVAQSAYNRDFRPLHVSWCVKNVLVRTPREIPGFPGTNIVNFRGISVPNQTKVRITNIISNLLLPLYGKFISHRVWL